MNDWRDDGACVDHPHLTVQDFFPEDLFPKDNAEKQEHIAMLRKVCGSCLVKDECRAWGDETQVMEGFLAGETSGERKRRWGISRRRTTSYHRNPRTALVPRPAGGPALP